MPAAWSWPPARRTSCASTRSSHTGRALREYDSADRLPGSMPRRRPRPRYAGAAPEAGSAPAAGRDPHRQCQGAQPARLVGRHTARQVQCGHRRQRLRQVHAGLRHPVQRGAAPLPGVAQRLRAQHRAAGRPAGGGRGLWHSTDGRDRAAAVPRRAQVDGGHRDRGLAFPAAAVSSSWGCSTACTTARRSPRRRPTASWRS
jgi:hypothetical protein